MWLEFAKLRAIRAYVPYVPYLPQISTYLHAYVPSFFTFLRAYVLTCLDISIYLYICISIYIYISIYITYIYIYIYIYFIHICLRAYVPSFFTCLRVYNQSQNILKLTSIPCIVAFLWNVWPFIPFKTPQQSPGSKTTYLKIILWSFVLSTGACTETIIWGLMRKLSKTKDSF